MHSFQQNLRVTLQQLLTLAPEIGYSVAEA
jgi:hypothetical protein